MLMKNKFSKFINLQGKYLTSLLFVLLFGVGQMWAAAPNQDLTMALPSSSTTSGDYTVYEYATPNNSTEHKVKNKGWYAEVPCADVSGKISLVGSSNKNSGSDIRYVYIYGSAGTTKDNDRKAVMSTTAQEISFTSSDIITVGSKYYIVLSTTDDYKSKGTNKLYVLTSSLSNCGGNDCTHPTVAWGVEPAGGMVGAADMTATVTTTPAEQAVTWISSVPAVATVSNGTIHYEAPGFTKISASFTYSGSDYCEEEAVAEKSIIVPITTDATGTNDKYWYYTTPVTSGSPDDGLYYSGTKSGSGLYGTKLNDGGYAWFAKPAVAGTLRVGAYRIDGQTGYEVNVYACDANGEPESTPLGSLEIPHIGGVSETMNIDADVEGIYIKRKTAKEGVLYFVEFKAEPQTCTDADATFAAASSIEIAYGDASASTNLNFTKGDNTSDPTFVVTKGGSATSDASVTGTTFTATAAGTYKVTATQAADGTYCEVEKEVTITVTKEAAPQAVCPTEGVIYKFETKASLSGNTNITDNPVSITTDNYLANFTSAGGSLSAYNNNKSFQISSNGLKLNDKSKAYLNIDLGSCRLQKGDIVKTKVTSQNAQLVTATSNGTEILAIAKNSNVQTYVLDADWDDYGTIYLLGKSNGAIVYSLEVIRPAKITLNANGGTIDEDELLIAVGETVILPRASKEGYIFGGWYTAPSGGELVANPYTVSSSTTLYAQYNEECPEYGTVYKFQVSTGLTNGNIVANSSDLPKDILATTDNYLSSIVGGALTIAARAQNNRVAIVNNNAIGFANGDDAYLVMDIDCGIKAGDIIKYTIASNNMDIKIDSPTESTNKMTLDRTKSQVEVDSKLVGASTLYMKRASSSPNISYFEIYRPKKDSVILDYNNGITKNDTLMVIDGEAFPEPAAEPTWAHHRFNGWQLNSAAYDFSTAVTGKIVLVADWTQLYTISFAAGEGGSGSAPAAIEDKAATETFTVPANTFTAPEGKEFDKWNDGTTDYAPGATYTVGTDNVILTALWRTPVPKFTVTYDLGYTTEAVAPTETDKAAGDGFALAAAPSRDYYTFDGWLCSADNKLKAAGAAYTMTDANTTFTAKWTPFAELEDTYIWQKKSGATGCVADPQADVNANSALTALTHSSLTMSGMTTLGRVGNNTEVVWTFNATREGYAIKSICTYGKLEEPLGAQISWDGGISWENLAVYSEQVKTFNAPFATFPSSFKIKFVSVSDDTGGLWWRNALVTLELAKNEADRVISVQDVKINETSISDADLATLIADHTLNITDEEAVAPEVTFIQRTTVNFTDASSIYEDKEVAASITDIVADHQWKAEATINNVDYVITLAQPTDPILDTETTALTLVSKTISMASKQFTFSGRNLENDVMISLASDVEGLTVNPIVVSPDANGRITNQEVTVSYASLEDVAEANIVLTVFYSNEVKKEIALTYSSTKGYVALAPVTGDYTWDFSKAALSENVAISNSNATILANYDVANDATIKTDNIEVKGERVTKTSNIRAHYVHFHTTVPGRLTLEYSNTGGNNARTIYVNGGLYDKNGSENTTKKTNLASVYVPAGDVVLEMEEMSTGDAKNVQLYKMIFTASNLTPDYTREVSGNYGTICLPNGGVMVGAAIFEIAYMDYQNNKPYKIYFDEVLNGEMVAGMPYIFLPEENVSTLGVYYTDAANADAGNQNGLYGSYTKTLLDKNDGNYILKNNQYWYVNSDDVYVGENRAYIKLAGVPDYNPGQPAYGRRRVSMNVNAEQVVTDMENINASEQPVKLIINGQLFIIRGEKMFNANGQLVK